MSVNLEDHFGALGYTQKKILKKNINKLIMKIFIMCVAKLIGGKPFNSQLDENDYIAILSSRIGLIKPKCLTTSQKLVASNIAVCTFVNSE